MQQRQAPLCPHGRRRVYRRKWRTPASTAAGLRYNGGTTVADDSVNPLVRQITERLPWLFSDYGFKIVDSSYSARSFGDCVVTLESESLRLRFVRDRGFCIAQLASRADPEKLHDLGFLL